MPGAALITGAGRRIGRTLALAVAGAGYSVAIHHHASHDDAESLAEEIRGLGRNAVCLAADLTEAGAPADLVAQTHAALGAVTLLVNNASVFQDDRIQSLTRESWDRHMEANLFAPVALTQAFAAALPAGAQGLVVNILDQRVWRPNPQFFSYTLSKLALWDATRTLAQALAPTIRVNAIGPGPTLPSIHQAPGDFEAEAAATPLGHPVSPDEIAAALRYLIDARSVTGQMIAVDAGQHLSWRTPDILEP